MQGIFLQDFRFGHTPISTALKGMSESGLFQIADQCGKKFGRPSEIT